MLVAAASSKLRTHRRAGFTHVCAAALDEAGWIHFGLEVAHRAGTVCAEPVALGAAALAGGAAITAIAAVCYTPDLSRIVAIPPCGKCREVLWSWAPDARVVLTDRAVRAADLFQYGALFEETCPQPQ